MKQRNSGRRRPAPKQRWKKHIKEVSWLFEPGFHAACSAAGISPTERQLKKWNKRTGIAWATANHV